MSRYEFSEGYSAHEHGSRARHPLFRHISARSLLRHAESVCAVLCRREPRCFEIVPDAAANLVLSGTCSSKATISGHWECYDSRGFSSFLAHLRRTGSCGKPQMKPECAIHLQTCGLTPGHSFIQTHTCATHTRSRGENCGRYERSVRGKSGFTPNYCEIV